MKLVMAMKVRDEGDVLEDNLRFHHALGVGHFIVTDNRSSDETVDVLARYERAGLATILREDSEDYSREALGWMQAMARRAATEHAADWVIHGDADEFWWPVEGTLPEALAAIPERFGAVVAPRTEFVGRPDGPGSFAERLTVREARSSLRPKLVHRGDPEVVLIDRGAHHITSRPEREAGERGPDRAVFRTGEDRLERYRAPAQRFVWAPAWPLRVLHFPIRSRAQVRKRAEVFLYGAGFANRGAARARLRERYEAGDVDAIYDGLAWSDAEVEQAAGRGELVHDLRLRELLPRCPDPLAADPPPAGTVRISPATAERDRELAELELDAMTLLTRFANQLVVAKQRLQERVEELEETQRGLRQRLRRLRADSEHVGG